MADIPVPDETLLLLVRLADDRWRELRRMHNRSFMCHGPGREWDMFKEAHSGEFAEIDLLQAFVAEHGSAAIKQGVV